MRSQNRRSVSWFLGFFGLTIEFEEDDEKND